MDVYILAWAQFRVFNWILKIYMLLLHLNICDGARRRKHCAVVGFFSQFRVLRVKMVTDPLGVVLWLRALAAPAGAVCWSIYCYRIFIL